MRATPGAWGRAHQTYVRDVSPASWVCKLGVTNNIARSWRRGIARVRLSDVPERVCMRVVEDPVPVQCKTKYDKSEEAA